MDRNEAYSRFCKEEKKNKEDLVTSFNNRAAETVDFCSMLLDIESRGHDVRPIIPKFEINVYNIPGREGNTAFITYIKNPENAQVERFAWNSDEMRFYKPQQDDKVLSAKTIEDFITEFDGFKAVCLRGIDQIIGYDDRPAHGM